MVGLALPVLLLLAQPAERKPPAQIPAEHEAHAPAQRIAQAARIIQEDSNTQINLWRALRLYKEHVAHPSLGADERAKALTDMSRARLRLGDLSTDKKKKLRHYKAGRDLAQKAQKLDPRLADAYFWEAANLAVIGRTNGAASSLFMVGDLKTKLYKTLEIDPGHLLAQETIASVYAAVPGLLGGDDERAEKGYRAILKADNHFTATKVTYANFLIERDQKGKARKLLREVVNEKHPTRPHDWRKFSRPTAQKTLVELK